MSVTSIEWTKRPGTIGETWNPTTGCNKVDRGCKFCYAEIMHKRLRAMGQAKYSAPFLDGAVPQYDALYIPMHWTKPRTVFVNSMSDLFHENLPFEFIAEVFQVIQLTPQHTYLVLTKRPEIAGKFKHWMGMTNGTSWNFPANLWLGTSANDQQSADDRVPTLLSLAASVLFLSYEPATGPLDLKCLGLSRGESWAHNALTGEFNADGNTERNFRRLDWVIMGGESGPKAVPMHPAWARSMRDDCKAAGVPFFFKQWGTWEPFTATIGDGTTVTRFTNDAKIFTFDQPLQTMRKVGKHKSGHEIDGKMFQEFPNLDIQNV